MIESLSLIDAVMPDVVASRQKEADRQKAKTESTENNNTEENNKHPYCKCSTAPLKFMGMIFIDKNMFHYSNFWEQ